MLADLPQATVEFFQAHHVKEDKPQQDEEIVQASVRGALKSSDLRTMSAYDVSFEEFALSMQELRSNVSEGVWTTLNKIREEMLEEIEDIDEEDKYSSEVIIGAIHSILFGNGADFQRLVVDKFDQYEELKEEKEEMMEFFNIDAIDADDWDDVLAGTRVALKAIYFSKRPIVDSIKEEICEDGECDSKWDVIEDVIDGIYMFGIARKDKDVQGIYESYEGRLEELTVRAEKLPGQIYELFHYLEELDDEDDE